MTRLLHCLEITLGMKVEGKFLDEISRDYIVVIFSFPLSTVLRIFHPLSKNETRNNGRYRIRDASSDTPPSMKLC